MFKLNAFTFGTDTATLCVYDPAVISHRVDDSVDWWSLPEEELLEVNSGTAFICGLQSDGVYKVILNSSATSTSGGVSALLLVVSGLVYIGAGEDLPGGGRSPNPQSPLLSGRFLKLPSGVYLVSATIADISSIYLSLSRSDGDAKNSFHSQLLLVDAP